MNGFEAYQMYMALKRHFTSQNYDYFKYNKKTKIRVETYEKRKDVSWFRKLAKHKDIEGFLVANFLIDHDVWVGNILSNEGETAYLEWKRRKESLTYVYKSEVSKLISNEKFNDLFKIISNGEHPFLLKAFLRKDVCIETLIILIDLANAFGYWQQKMKDDLMWNDLSIKIIKYKPFLKYDENKFRNLTKEIVISSS